MYNTCTCMYISTEQSDCHGTIITLYLIICMLYLSLNAGIFNQAEIVNRLLCPTFSDFFLDNSHSVSIECTTLALRPSNYPLRACTARGKVIGCVVVVSTKIAICVTLSRDLGTCTWATRKHNESLEFGEKLTSVCFKSMKMVHEHHKVSFCWPP
jgi:hypothetical protein